MSDRWTAQQHAEHLAPSAGERNRPVPGGPWLGDPRSRARRLLGPGLAIAGLAVATAYVALVDPNEPGHYPGCPTQTYLGIDCPGCGGLRATHALARGDVAGSLDHNVLVVLGAPVVAVLLFFWVRRAWRGVINDPAQYSARRARLERVVPLVIVGVMLVFSVVRNLVPYLGSGVG
jgi:hypothetical protein